MSALLGNNIDKWSLFATVILLYLIYMPGSMNPDAISFYVNATRLDNLALYHPPFMAYIFAVGRFFSADQSAILLMQVSSFFLGVWVLLRLTVRSPAIIALALPIVAFSPAIFPILGGLWKSVWMTALATAVFGLSVWYYRKPSLVLAAVSMAMCLVASLIRFDAVVPLSIPVMIMVLATIRHWKPDLTGRLGPLRSWAVSYCLALPIIVVLFLGAGWINKAITTKDLYPLHVPLLHDLAGVSILSDHIYMPPYFVAMNENLSATTLANAYDFKTCNAMLRVANSRDDGLAYKYPRPASEEQLDEIKSAWVHAITEQPGAYVETRLRMLKVLWGFTSRPFYPFASGVSRNSLGIESVWTPSKKIALAYSKIMAYGVTYFHKPYLYIVLLCFLFVGFIRMGRFEGSRYLSALPFMGILHFFAVSTISCSADFRFAFFLVVTAVLSTIIFVAHLRTGVSHRGDTTNAE